MSLKKQALTGVSWTFVQQFSTQGIGFIVSIVLARLLLPVQFGLIGMIAVFVAIGSTLIDSGFTQSLIRHPNPNQEDYSTVFFFNLGGSLIIYLIVFFSAPYIAEFYHQPALRDIVRVYCVSFVISAFGAVQNARLTKLMDFKAQMIIAIPSLVGGSVLGILLAFNGYGVWSLVWMSLLQNFLNAIQLWLKTGWSPSLMFNIDKFKTHFKFGYKLTIANIIETIFNNIYQILIGHFFIAAEVGYFTRANSLKQLPVSNISNALHKVTFPLFASIQEDQQRMKKAYKTIMQAVIFLIAPVLTFMGVLAVPLFRFLFTDKWLPAAPYFQILCIAAILYPIHAYNLNVLLVKGRSDLFLRLEIIKKTLVAGSIAISISFGIFALLWSQVIISIVAFFINTHYSGKIIGYSALEQARDIAPTIILAIVSGVGVYYVDDLLKLNNQIDFIRILVAGLSGAIVYLSGAYLFKFSSLDEIKLLLIKKWELT